MLKMVKFDEKYAQCNYIAVLLFKLMRVVMVCSVKLLIYLYIVLSLFYTNKGISDTKLLYVYIYIYKSQTSRYI